MPVSNSGDLYLLRHGIAQERIGGLDHAERALAEKGRLRTTAMAHLLVQRGVSADVIVTSPFRRALETAQIALQAGLAPVLDVDDALQPGGDAASVLRRAERAICLVGHEPDLSGLASRLLGLRPGAIALRKAGLIHLSKVGGQWDLQALLRPGLLLDLEPC